MYNSEPKNIGAIISDLIKNLGYEKKLSELDAVKNWEEVAGDKISKISRAIKISDGRLTVRVPDPAWKQQLIFLKKELIAALNARLGKAVVNDIYFV
ncbi:MAG TPA: DUF721 domain-containing protein [candidate division Zixibacteria bacterium]|nr:DUF721 domain-containing protein [candidate division Zixibacteria bacterium]